MTNMKNLSKRGLALLVVLVMCLGMLNLSAFAAGSEQAYCPTCEKDVDLVILAENEAKDCQDKPNQEWACPDCGYILAHTNYGDPGPHDYQSEVTEPATCTEEGIMTYTCSLCGDSYTESISKTDHTPGAPELVNEPTCTDKGNWNVLCTVCGVEIDHLSQPALDADYTGQKWEPAGNGQHKMVCRLCEGANPDHVQFAVCEDKDNDGKCDDCGADLGETCDHTVGNHEDISQRIEPTCTEKGQEVYVCNKCGGVVANKELAPTGHDWDDGMVTKEPTATEPGVITFTCKNDPTHTKTEEIPALSAPEVPEGAKLQEVIIAPSFFVEQDGKYPALQNFPIVSYDYSYEYGGETYEGTTTAQEIIPGVFSEKQVLKVLVAEDGSVPTQVQLTLKDYEVEGYAWYAQKHWDATAQWNTTDETTISASVKSTTTQIWQYNYYRVNAETPKPDETVTTREVDIVVTFETVSHEPFTLDKLPEDYAVTYSYVDSEGETVMVTLNRESAEEIDIPRAILEEVDGVLTVVGTDENNPYHYFKWTVEVPVIGDGIYLTLTQSNYAVSEAPYVWDSVYGTTDQVDGTNIGRLYVSKNNNPVTPYVYNVYAKEYTVTYTDGVEDSEVFADQSYQAKEGTATPGFNGTPTRNGYTFTGWNPVVADTVNGDVTYVAQWSQNSNPTPPSNNDDDDDYTPSRRDDDNSDPTPELPPEVEIEDEEPPLTDLPEEDVPLSELPEEPDAEELTDLPEEEVPLADVPETGDNSALWLLTAGLAAAGVAGVVLTGKKREDNAL